MNAETLELSEETIGYLTRVLMKHWMKGNRLEKAQDLTQEGLEEAELKKGEYRGHSAKKGSKGKKAGLETYLVRVALNRGYTTLRKERRHETILKRERHMLIQDPWVVGGGGDALSKEERRQYRRFLLPSIEE